MAKFNVSLASQSRWIRNASSFSSPAKPSRKVKVVDSSQNESMKKQIWSEYFSDPQAADKKRLRAFKAVLPSVEAHETIARAWALHQRIDREEREAALKTKYLSIREAMDQLEDSSPRLFQAAQEKRPSLAGLAATPAGRQASKEGRIPGLFPRQMRVPTETLGDARFDEDWKRS